MIISKRVNASPRVTAIGGMVAALFAACSAAAGAPVGEVTLLIGEAHLVRVNGAAKPLRTGDVIEVGDRIETSGSGHVFLRFIDRGAVSLRPGSVLEVQAYRFDEARPQNSEVRLKMEQGTGRSVSGAATRLDKSRFRMNTPIAAIGVRGTDFIVQTDATRTRATVAEGAIVIGPLGPQCAGQPVDACAGAPLRYLSADMGRVVAEMRAGDSNASLVPAAPGMISTGYRLRLAAEARAAETAALNAGLRSAEPDAPGHQRHLDDKAAELLAEISLPKPEPEAEPLPPPVVKQLAWGRWTFSPAASDTVSVPYSVASIDRHITVANDQVGLFRADDPANPKKLLPESLDARVEFRLSRGQASYESPAGVQAAAINGGTLVLDFAQRTFATALALSAAGGTATELRAAGDVRPDGTFAMRDALQRVAGAVSLDGREAGYLFERAADGGLFKGTTLWGR